MGRSRGAGRPTARAARAAPGDRTLPRRGRERRDPRAATALGAAWLVRRGVGLARIATSAAGVHAGRTGRAGEELGHLLHPARPHGERRLLPETGLYSTALRRRAGADAGVGCPLPRAYPNADRRSA